MRKLLALFVLLAACSAERSFDIRKEGVSLASCDRAQLEELTPAGGGFKLVCATGQQAYFVTDTSNGAKGTNLAELSLSAPNELRCAATAGVPAVPRDNGTTELALAEPCGKVSVTLGDAR